MSTDEDPDVEGSYGYIVSQAAEDYVSALVDAGHQAETPHDRNETHSSLVGGLGETGDVIPAAIEAFLGTLP